MTSPRYAELASKLLARDEVAVAPPPAPVRAAAIDALETALRRKRQRRQRMRWVVGFGAMAAATLLGVGVRTYVLRHHDLNHDKGGDGAVAATAAAAPPAGVSVVAYPSGAGASMVAADPGAPDRMAPLADGKAVVQGNRVVAQPGGHLILSFSTGSQLSVEDEGDVTLAEVSRSQRFELKKGTVRADVAKLAPGQRFVVHTPDAEAEAHGTSFRVSIVPADASCGEGTTTRVVVYEGVVSVRHVGHKEELVTAGQEWPKCAAPTAANAPAPSAVSARAQPSARASNLAEVNDMFATAEQAKRSGATLEAVADFDRLLAKYPQSPLSESATAERMRLLRSVDMARAASTARQYLARYPHGFARADAEAILADGP